ncbi:unnamed protein product [Parnassius mnemosyne]|uniref:HAT C-terminal dimerisation domain-containing protein n=1 Tax=Parnassius mnemosyne TaxID=213953 RepID=A0AAV1L1G4_9NEOP
MGRKKTNTVYRYFELHEDGTSTCTMPECGKTFKTHHGANLLKHLKRIHEEEYTKVVDLNRSQEENTAIELQNCTNSEIVLRECTNLVVVHGRPFSLMNDTAFQNLISLIPNSEATVNAQAIKDNVKLTASNIRDELVNALQGKILSLKIDIIFHATRSFMGINCQYIEDGHIILQNLGIIEIFQRYSSEYLKELLINNLHRIGIDTEHNKQIYNITIDNGTNMIQIVDESGLNNDDASGDIPTDSHLCNTCESDLDMEYNIELEGTENIIDELSDVLRVRFQNHVEKPERGVEFVRCAVHILQLAIQDAVNDAAIGNMICSCKEVVRRLRTPQFVRLIKENEKKLPKLNFGTSWLSKVYMLKSLLSLKEICAMDARLHLPDSIWDGVEDFLKSITPVKYLTKKLQDELLTVGDFYIEWMMCIFKLTKINTIMSSNLIAKMKEREKTLFENDVFLNAIFLDPRVNSILTLDQQKQAKENLTNLYIRYFLKGYFGHEYKQDVTNTLIPTIDKKYEISEARGELDYFLNKNYINRHVEMMKQRSDTYADMLDNLQQSMTLFLAEPLLKSTENVLSYWEKARVRFPFLYRLSSIVLAAPITQVSVERLFSSVKFVLSNYRLSMKDDVIEDLLFIRNTSVLSKKEA